MASLCVRSSQTLTHVSLFVLCSLHLAVGLSEYVVDGNTSSLVLEFVPVESRVNSITIKWNITRNFTDVDELVVIHNKIGSKSTTYSGPHYNSTQLFDLDDLVAHTKYNVCLTMKVRNGESCPFSVGCYICEDMSTIPVIRDDSLIALILTIGLILLLIIIGCLCWQYAKKKKERGGDDDEDTESLVGSDESKQPILLSVPPTSNGPRHSVDFEDQDIPYITPPLEEPRTDQNDKRRDFFMST